MADLIVFRPRETLDAEAALRDYVLFARDQLTTFGNDLPFDENVWDITAHALKPGRTNEKTRLRFSRLGEPSRKEFRPLRDPFLSFAKAYIRHENTVKPTTRFDWHMSALRALEAALAESGTRPNPVDANPDVFNRAAQQLYNSVSPSTAYSTALHLQHLSARLVEFQIAKVRIPWTSFIRIPSNTSTRLGPEFDRRRKARLPTDAALAAIPQIYRQAAQPVDILSTAIIALLLCTPSRITEVLALPNDCEHKPGPDNYGLRWRPLKRADPMIKWVPTSMRFLAEEALEKIRAVTEPARLLAKWYEQHPNRIFLPTHLEHLRAQTYLSSRNVAAILGMTCTDSALKWCHCHAIETTLRQGRFWVRFDDIERQVVAELPPGFPRLPGTDLRYSEALFLVRMHEFHPISATRPCNFSPVNYSQIKDQLVSRGKRSQSSIFTRHGFAEPDGSPIMIRTHQFRHWLNSLAQQSGLSQLDIAKWSGRKDIHQNAAYDHEPADDILARIRDATGNTEKALGPLATLPERLPMTQEEFARLRFPTALTTDIGSCTHDWTMPVCPKFIDCINCEDLLFEKTPESRSRIRDLYQRTKSLLDKAKRMAQKQYAGANRWEDTQRAALARYDLLLAILDDPDVPDGTIFQLPPGKLPE